MNELPAGYMPLKLVSPPKHAFSKIDGVWHVYDIVRRRWVMLTPEEWVRQHLISEFLYRGYPLVTLSLEKSMSFNGIIHRFDLAVFGSRGIMLLAECKKFDIPLNDDILAQALRYNLTLRSPVLLITNGIQHQLFTLISDEYHFFSTRIPNFTELKRLTKQL